MVVKIRAATGSSASVPETEAAGTAPDSPYHCPRAVRGDKIPWGQMLLFSGLF